jgi:hypothetical protein
MLALWPIFNLVATTADIRRRLTLQATKTGHSPAQLSSTDTSSAPSGRAPSIALFSYTGLLSYGLLGDYDKLYDLELPADGLQTSVAELSASLVSSRDNGRPPQAAAVSPIE